MRLGWNCLSIATSITWGLVATGVAVDDSLHHHRWSALGMCLVAVCGFLLAAMSCSWLVRDVVDNVIDERFEDEDDTRPLAFNEGVCGEDEELLGG